MPDIITIMPCDEEQARVYGHRTVDYERGIIQIDGLDLFDLREEKNRKEIPLGIVVSYGMSLKLKKECSSNCLFLHHEHAPAIEKGEWIKSAYINMSNLLFQIPHSVGIKNSRILLIKGAYSFKASSQYVRIKFQETSGGKRDFLMIVYYGTEIEITFPNDQHEIFNF